MDNPQITVILLGKSEVGKSSIHYRFCSSDFDPPYQSTFGIRFKTQYIQVKGMTYAITLWDTAGEEKYKSVSPDYYKDAQVALVVYDTTNRESFETLKYWVDESKKHGPANQIIIIVGNMIDKINEQKVTEEEAISYANKLGITHQLISCKENKGMTELYESIVLDFNSKIKNQDLLTSKSIKQKQNNS